MAAQVTAVVTGVAGFMGLAIDVRHVPMQPGDVRDTRADLSRAAEVLGWRPEVTLADGLRAQVAAAQPST